jgi:hypothetical protein
MDVEVCRHALDRVPLSLIIDDSTALVNLNYFFIRDRNRHTGENRRWEDVPIATPEFFTREWAEWCGEHGVRGKFSVVPCPAGLGRIDQDLPLFGQAQLESWLRMCRDTIVPSFDITPEMLTHTYVLDLQTFQPLPSWTWEQYEWSRFGDDDRVDEYIAMSCRILENVGLPPQGVTSPGGFGQFSRDLYARAVGAGCRAVTGCPTPYFFQQLHTDTVDIQTPVWYPDREAGTAVAEIIACTDDWTGSWTGYDPVDPDYYITADLQGGRLPKVIDAGSPCILCSHWQGMYGLHDDDRRGFHTLQTIVERLHQRDPAGDRTCWRTCSEIGRYACARDMANVYVDGFTITVEAPVRVPAFTLRLHDLRVRGITVQGQPLREAGTRGAFTTGTFYQDGAHTLVAFDPTAPSHQGLVDLQVYPA